MADLIIEGKLADQLRDLAQRQQQSVESLLQTLVDRFADSPTLAQLAESLAYAEFHSGRNDTATNSREILEREYGDYLIRRSRQDDATR